MLCVAVVAVSVLAETTEPVSVTWDLSVDGVVVGKREVTVRYDGQTGERVRIVELWSEIQGGVRKRDRYHFQQRLTADTHEGAPASFHSVTEANGDPREIQAGFAQGAWNVTLVGTTGSRTTALERKRVDLSTVDLFDPDSDLRIWNFTTARVLSAETGKILEGPVTAQGPSELVVGGETLQVDGYLWATERGLWRLWYATNGFLVKYEAPMLEHQVTGMVIGEAPRGIDEFPVGEVAVVEVSEL